MRWNKLHRRQILEETLVLIESYENSLEDEIQRVRKAKKLIKSMRATATTRSAASIHIKRTKYGAIDPVRK